jgi:hypothetical protein
MGVWLMMADEWQRLQSGSGMQHFAVEGRQVSFDVVSDGFKSENDHQECQLFVGQKTWSAWPGRQSGGSPAQLSPVEVFEMQLVLPHDSGLDCEGSVVTLASIVLPRLPTPTA